MSEKEVFFLGRRGSWGSSVSGCWKEAAAAGAGLSIFCRNLETVRHHSHLLYPGTLEIVTILYFLGTAGSLVL